MDNAKTLFIKKIQDKIGKNLVPDVIKDLIEIRDINPKTAAIEGVYALSGRFTQITEEETNGIRDSREIDIEKNKIRDGLLKLAKNVDKDTSEQFFDKNSIFRKIALICRDENSFEDLNRLFSNRYYKRPKGPMTPDEFIEKSKTESFDLIVFNDFPRRRNTRRIPEKLVEIMDTTKDLNTPVLVYTPENLSGLMDSYRDRAYTANSKFSIHSRIREMLLFLKHEAVYRANKQNEEPNADD